MAMEMHVLFRGTLPSKTALQRAIRSLGFPLTIASKGSLAQQSGFLPMRLRCEDRRGIRHVRGPRRRP